LFKLQYDPALKRLAAAVQLRLWPPFFKALNPLSRKRLSPQLVRTYRHHCWELHSAWLPVLRPIRSSLTLCDSAAAWS